MEKLTVSPPSYSRCKRGVVSMKKMLYAFLMIFGLISCSSESNFREEIIERHAGGGKKIVVGFRGHGSNEQLVERFTYDESGDLILKEDLVNNIKLNWTQLNSEMSERHLKHYFILFEEFCLGQLSQQEANKNIVGSGRLRIAKDYEGVYEEIYEGIIYGVSPEADACVVDVMLELEKGKILMSLSDVQEVIEKLRNYRLRKTVDREQDGLNSKPVFTVESQYYPQGSDKNTIILTYPTNNQGAFFMTLAYHYE
jgi:hypothetical protein